MPLRSAFSRLTAAEAGPVRSSAATRAGGGSTVGSTVAFARASSSNSADGPLGGGGPPHAATTRAAATASSRTLIRFFPIRPPKGSAYGRLDKVQGDLSGVVTRPPGSTAYSGAVEAVVATG